MEKDITGQKFGRLTALYKTGKTPRSQAIWLFYCECGNSKPIVASNVQRGRTNSCGCFALEASVSRGKNSKKHGHHNSPTYTSYHSMIQRCHNPRSLSFPAYGGAGVSVCERWLSGFQFFLDDMGERPAGTTLDRIDGKLGYAPNNCRWATITEQNNNLRSNRILEFMGKKQSVAQWSRELEIPDNTLRKRLKYMSVTDALSKPHLKKNRH